MQDHLSLRHCCRQHQQQLNPVRLAAVTPLQSVSPGSMVTFEAEWTYMHVSVLSLQNGLRTCLVISLLVSCETSFAGHGGGRV
jgi:hypothetical protein